MKKKKLLSILSTGALALSLLAPSIVPLQQAEAATTANWDVERYGDRVDIDGKLNKLAQDEEFLKKAEAKIKEQGQAITDSTSTQNEKGNTKEKGTKKGTQDTTTSADSESNESTFTYDGGTKYFLDRDLAFKEFTLRSVGENVEIWVANDLSFPDERPAHVVTQEQVDKLRNEFDNNIYPKATEFFGTPDVHNGSNSPLVDWGYFPEGYYETSDKVIMLVDNIKDEGYYNPSYPFFVAGFFWQTLENYIDRNIITIDTNSWETRLESTFYGTTIHELQHLIHADNDGAEETWINEGMSTFSEYLGGYGHDASSINFYLDHPENSLTLWDDHYAAKTGPETIADYGQVQLFTTYLYDKFGREFIRDLAVNKKQSIESIEDTFVQHNINMTFTDVYQNFITALAIDSDRVGDGVYNIDSVDLRALPVDKDGTVRGKTIDYEKATTFEKEGVPAWGGDFKQLDFEDKISGISFDGIDFLGTQWVTTVDPVDPGNQVLWGNKGDEADNMLIFEADLSNVATATLNFDHYLDIEAHWDFGVVQVSTDNGQTWTSLANENTTSNVVDEGYPKIKENVPGFTGNVKEWGNETFDLSEYAGQNVLISFRYLTDWGYNDTGWFIDNIEIPEIGYTNDGSSIEGFKSQSEVLGQYVEYTVTFINETQAGSNNGSKTNYKIVTVEPFNVTEEDALQLRQLFQDGKNYMITSYAAPADQKNSVDFTYEVELKTNNRK